MLKEHEATCNFTLVKCPLGCGEMVMRYKLSSHIEEECLKRTYHCRLCGKSGPYDEIMDRHRENECPLRHVKCQNYLRGCRMFVLQCRIEEHRAICPYEIIRCKYKKTTGCDFQLICKNNEMMQNHEANSDLHLALALDTINKLQQSK